MKKGYNLIVENIHKKVKNNKIEKTILTNVNLKINEGEFIAIVGCSGAGKTTLINIMSGYTKPSIGSVYINNLNLNNNIDYLKEHIGYVPQKEILNDSLTLIETLKYAIKLRIKNISEKETNKRINNILKILELDHKKDIIIKKLSGGERKRTSIALEMLNEPELFLLDEPTSGLDSHIEKKIMQKFKEISNSGKTIVITAHTVSNLNLCDKIIFMGNDGKICYYGTYEEIFKYFNVKDFIDIYDILKENTDLWYQKYIKQSNEINIIENKNNHHKIKKVSFLKQTEILTKRYIKTIFNNKILLFLTLGQAPLMGFLICLAAQKDTFASYQTALMGISAFTLAAVWLGLFNSIQEIVKERDILKKECMSGLRFSSYIISKIIVFSILCLFQAITIISIVYLWIDPKPTDILIFHPYINLIINFFLVSFSASMTGLFISSIVKTRETTLIIAPLYMMFQILFSGTFVVLNNLTKPISNMVIGRWSAEGFGTISNFPSIATNTNTKINFSQFDINNFLTSLSNLIDTSIDSLTKIFTNQMFINNANEFYYFTPNHLISTWLILLTMAIIFMTLSILIIKKSILNTK